MLGSLPARNSRTAGGSNPGTVASGRASLPGGAGPSAGGGARHPARSRAPHHAQTLDRTSKGPGTAHLNVSRGERNTQARVVPDRTVHGDEGAFRHWMRFELDTIHSGLVTQRRALADLLREPRPTAPSRGGAHPFDPKELQRLAGRVPTELRFTLRLPLQVYVDSEVGDAVYVLDPAVAEALPALGIQGSAPDRQGRVWFGRALGLVLVRDWPTCAQFVYL